jgi:hypothetical protein
MYLNQKENLTDSEALVREIITRAVRSVRLVKMTACMMEFGASLN